MKKRTIFSILLIVFMAMPLMVFSGCDIIDTILASEPPPPPGYYDEIEEPEPEPEPVELTEAEAEWLNLSAWEQRFRSMPMAFGFANKDGNKLIHVFYGYEELVQAAEEEAAATEDPVETDEDTDEEEDAPNNYFAITGFDPDRYSLAIGPFGDIRQISFAFLQDEGRGNNGREIATNFDRLPGFVFAQKQWKLAKNKMHLMTEMSALLDNIVAIGSPGWKGNTPPMEEETIESIEKHKERKVEWGKTLAVTLVDEALIGLVLYERQGNDMLFSIVYMDEEKTLFWDNPAEYDEESTWRTDAGEEPGQFEPLILARFDEGLMLMLIWSASDGDIAVTLYEEDGVFKEAEDLSFFRKTSG